MLLVLCYKFFPKIVVKISILEMSFPQLFVISSEMISYFDDETNETKHCGIHVTCLNTHFDNEPVTFCIRCSIKQPPRVVLISS